MNLRSTVITLFVMLQITSDMKQKANYLNKELHDETDNDSACSNNLGGSLPPPVMCTEYSNDKTQ